MPHLKECSRSAAIAFSPLGPHLAAGTVAGVIDMSFSTSSVLEVFSTDFSTGSKELMLAGGPTSAPERFQRLAWGRLGSDGAQKAGVLAGGLADGTVLVWDAAKVIGSPAAAEGAGTHVSKLTKHTGPVRGLQFNSLNSPHLLASGGADAEINIWNLTDLRRPSSYPASRAGANGQAAAAEVSAVAWNHLADHILASGAGGSVTVWDLKQQRPRSVLRDDNRNPRRISALAWHPVVATKIVVAYEDDHCPVLQLWDLRQSVSHVCEYQGHAKGILGLSWCLQDPGMLVSTGKDSRTLLWDADRGQQLGGFATPSFNFDVAWSPTQPGVLATSSYGGGGGDDGTVTLHNLASFSAGDAHASSNGHMEPAPLARAPAWLRRPVGASFGFGGRLATLSNEQRPSVSVRQVTTERELVERSQRFEAAIRGGDRAALAGFCEAQAAAAPPDAAQTWRFLRVHFEEDPRGMLMAELGFEGMLPPPEPPAEEGADAAAEQLDDLALQPPQPPQQPAEPPPEFDGDGTDFFDNDDGKDAFEPEPPAAAAPPTAAPERQPASPAAGAKEEAGKNEDAIQRALFVGNFAAALDACFEAGRMADALVIGHMGQGPHLARAQREYMRRQPRPYMRVVRAVLDGDLLSMVKSRPLAAWRETLALLTSYSQGEEWASLCDALARRLAAAGQAHAATLAWVCAGSVDAAVRAWGQALQRGGVTVAGLQGLMERAVVLGLGVQQQTATPSLAELLSQYAGILASQGCMGMALEYLDMIPGEPAGPTGVLKDRIYYSGAPDVPPDAPPPPYPFADAAPAVAAPAPAPAQQPAAPAAAGDFFSANAYRTSGTYGGGGSYAASAGAYSQPPPTQQQQQPQPAAYADYGQAGYDAYAQQGQVASTGYGQAGYSFGAASQPPPAAAPPTQPAYAQAKPASPSYAKPAYGGYEQQQQQPAYSAYSAPAPPQRPPQQQAPAVSQGWQQPAASAGPSSWGQPTQPPSPAAPAALAPPLPQQPPALFVPSRPSAAPSQPPQQVQAPLFVPTSLGAAKPVAPGLPGGPPPSFAQPQQPPTPPAPSTPAPPPAPAGPPANISITSADTSKVPADAQPIVRTLRAVYERCAPVAAAAPGKRREMEDTARRLGQLFWRLNVGETSPRVVASLRELCAALDARDFATAAQKQVQLTSSDWDECSSFLTGLKRLIKAAQMLG